ncbi:AAA family ATPase, partial [archaeon]|nr:AAA family ATPase [archaeon]
LEAIVRLSEASARGRLSNYVEIEDVERALRLHQFVMREIMMDKETGRLDADIIMIGKSKSKMDRARAVLHIVRRLCDENDVVTHEMVLDEAKESGINTMDIDEMISMLKKNGDLYSPRHGQYKLPER